MEGRAGSNQLISDRLPAHVLRRSHVMPGPDGLGQESGTSALMLTLPLRRPSLVTGAVVERNRAYVGGRTPPVIES